MGHAEVGVADVLAEAEEVLDAASVGMGVEAELLEGLPRAVQLNPPVLRLIASHPVVFTFASLKML